MGGGPFGDRRSGRAHEATPLQHVERAGALADQVRRRLEAGAPVDAARGEESYLLVAEEPGGRQVRIADIIYRTDTTGTDPTKLPLPSGNFDYGDAVMTGSQYEYGSNQGFFWTFNKPAYFWFTRNGIRGRDF